jgi:hypothetical protein
MDGSHEILRERRTQKEGPTTRSAMPMPDGHSCYTCNLGIEMRYSASGARSKSQGYSSHLDDVEGIAADLDHDALR